ncbi:hypothetical protein SUGI_0680150 [Cryptomeria japonica]|uniref:protein neprosin n=2 Tax=Cryptomeria japonica TaxID=3369 RepID=UPI00241471EF|nr:protein neprosin [Cryptomeria japonica]XP_057830633.1 protein neprosin [Cryptomeria japonica]XP_059065042.1 protein neprosin [Cryptomeria japonica]GLJ33829.1 hypothetical protein SUGI_0680100 [Cryptomeria japonica]GLJ33834.1 hypothetical protein SUGI_0680150 [Cryptomeria japonica]
MTSGTVFSVFISFIFIPLILAADLNDDTINGLSKLQTMTIDEYINYINPPAVHKFQNGNGEKVLCVKYEDQISLQSGNTSKGSRDNFAYKNSSAEECPEGSVPIVEITRERVERAGSLRQYLNTGLHDNTQKTHEEAKSAVAFISPRGSQEIHEIKASFNVWQPSVDTSNSVFSAAILRLLHENPDESINEAMEAGWMVYPSRYGSPRVTFYVAHRVFRKGEEKDCIDLSCKDFIQEGKEYYPGMPIPGISAYDGTQMDSTISIRRETRGNNANNLVWAVYLQDKLVGHWPAILFHDLTFYGNLAQIGGQVVIRSGKRGTPFPKTEMGSGDFARKGFKKAAFVRNIRLFTNNGALITDRKTNYFLSKRHCYGIKGYVKQDDYWGHHIYYGGPGGNAGYCTY